MASAQFDEANIAREETYIPMLVCVCVCAERRVAQVPPCARECAAFTFSMNAFQRPPGAHECSLLHSP